MIKGQIISGNFGEIIIRQKSDKEIELGELLIADTAEGKILLQVSDLIFGSQLSQQNIEMVSGMKLEDNIDFEFFDKKQRSYILAQLKPLISIRGKKSVLSKTMPSFFSDVREVTKDDLAFLTKPKNPLFFGKLRSGSKTLDVDVFLDGKEVFSHHILIPGTTGRGKSVLVKNILWNVIDQDYCGLLVLDPHDEYYGRNKPGLKDKKSDKVVYYSKTPPPGCKTLKINVKSIKPAHFNGVVFFSDPQQQAIYSYYKYFGKEWIKAIILDKKLPVDYNESTLAVVKRRIMSLLDISLQEDVFICIGVFDFQAGETTIADICLELEDGKIVIVDTSSFSGAVEILIGSLIATEIFRKYKNYKIRGQLKNKPVISIILEEAPRVLGKEVLEKGTNIFSTIAREGRKFNIGLTAITQLPSLIPREILANMNTKIILGIEMAPERQAIIESASQDLSQDNRNIASLDKGEALITSNFARFATPVKIPFFDDVVKEQSNKSKIKDDFSSVNLG